MHSWLLLPPRHQPVSSRADTHQGVPRAQPHPSATHNCVCTHTHPHPPPHTHPFPARRSQGLCGDHLSTGGGLLPPPTPVPPSCPGSLQVSIHSISQSVSSSGAQVTPSQLPLPLPPQSVCSQLSPMPSLRHSLPSETPPPLSRLSSLPHLPTRPAPPPYLSPSSVCLPVHLSTLRPSSPVCPASLSALWAPSVTSKTASPSQAVTSWRLPAACLSVCPPAHPSVRLPSHPSCHSHWSTLATTRLLSDWAPRGAPRPAPVGVCAYEHTCSHP